MKLKRSGKKRKWWKILIVIAVLALLYVFLYWAGTARFEVSFYEVSTQKAETPVRIVAISDLHNTEFGENNCELVSRITALAPDLIVILGDMNVSGDENIDTTVSLCEQLVELAPVYYTYGNHENEMVYGSDVTEEFLAAQRRKQGIEKYETLDYSLIEIVDDRLPKELDRLGITVLNNNAASVQVGNTQIDIVGVDNLGVTFYTYSYPMVAEVLATEPENLKLILAHRPMIASAMSQQEKKVLSYDLMLCGHTHGGIIRVPRLGGMFADGGFWPWFTGGGREAGYYDLGQGSVIVSRGLGNRWPIPRINNVPDLVVVDLD